MNLVDSCGWLEYVADGPNADFFMSPIKNSSKLIVPTICIFEVFKRLHVQRGEDIAMRAVSGMRRGLVIELDSQTAVIAAKLSVDLKLPMADSIILATARAYKAVIWTQDKDFKGIDGVEYIEKK